MKKMYLAIALLAMVNVALFADGTQPTTAESEETEKVTCVNGGEGASACSIDKGHKIGDIVTTGCSVSCGEGTYACCGERCICIKIES